MEREAKLEKKTDQDKNKKQERKRKKEGGENNKEKRDTSVLLKVKNLLGIFLVGVTLPRSVLSLLRLSPPLALTLFFLSLFLYFSLFLPYGILFPRSRSISRSLSKDACYFCSRILYLTCIYVFLPYTFDSYSFEVIYALFAFSD